LVPVTDNNTRWGLPSHVQIETGRSGLANTSYAKGEDIESVSQGRLRLVIRYGLADEHVVRRLDAVLRTLLEL
jgi:mRNA interferase MazF